MINPRVHELNNGLCTLTDIVEGLACVGTTVLWEDFGDLQFVYVTLAAVLEVLAGLDLFVVVQPDAVKAGRFSALVVTALDLAGQDDGLSVVYVPRLDVLHDLGPELGLGLGSFRLVN